MGNNPSKAGSSGSSPTAASAHQGQPSRHTSQRHHHHRSSVNSPSIPIEAAHGQEPNNHSGPQRTLSPPTRSTPHQHNHPHHVHSSSASSSPGQRARGETGRMGNAQSQEIRRRELEAAQTSPVQVPQQRRQKGPPKQLQASGPPRDIEYVPVSNLHLPPRLPLPIEEEIYTPGSPIITPEDLSTDIIEDDIDGVLPRPTSLLSHTTADEDEEEDAEIEYSLDAPKGKTVPTFVEWKQGGDKVYITGTFAGWSRKYRMHRDPEDPKILSATLQLPPGTHHVKFIVDGEMQLSDELPTAVDYTNILVNYIEVSADDLPQNHSRVEKPPNGLHPPLVQPPGIDTKDHETGAVGKTLDDHDQPLIPTNLAHYGQIIPQYLADLDRDQDTNHWKRAADHVEEIPNPPILPLFLNKSILNGNMPTKDDSSVLNLPNHTVLNHLATSSIKNGVLATSVTTRYKRKYVTTIMYRPTGDD